RVTCRRFSMFDEAIKQGDFLILFPQKPVTKVMTHSQSAKGSNSIGKQGVGAIEGIDESAAVCRTCPPVRLDGATAFKCQFVKLPLCFYAGDLRLIDQPPKAAIGAN